MYEFMIDLIFIGIIAVFIAGMLWSDRDSRPVGFRFIGFDNDRYYSTTRFTVGNIYIPAKGTFKYLKSSAHSEASFKDDSTNMMWEELRYFKKVRL